MSLSANQNIQIKQLPVRAMAKIVDGLIHIFRGSLLSYEYGNEGYVLLSSDSATWHQFAGIAVEEKNLTAALNTTDGTYEVEIIPRGTGEWVLLPVTSTITIANEGDPVYADNDGAVDIASGIVNSVTHGLVGIIRQYVGANSAWVQLTQHPTL